MGSCITKELNRLYEYEVLGLPFGSLSKFNFAWTKILGKYLGFVHSDTLSGRVKHMVPPVKFKLLFP